MSRELDGGPWAPRHPHLTYLERALPKDPGHVLLLGGPPATALRPASLWRPDPWLLRCVGGLNDMLDLPYHHTGMAFFPLGDLLAAPSSPQGS